MQAEKQDISFTIKENFTAVIEIPTQESAEEGDSDDKTAVQVQVFKDSVKENSFLINFKRVQGDLFVFNECYQKFYEIHYGQEYP